jgi:hypothetical protein
MYAAMVENHSQSQGRDFESDGGAQIRCNKFRKKPRQIATVIES